MSVHTFLDMDFEWDPTKAIANRRKHNVRFAEAATVLEDEHAITVPEEHPDELRFVTMGVDSQGRLLVVVYCHRGQRIRVISARRANKRERQAYESDT